MTSAADHPGEPRSLPSRRDPTAWRAVQFLGGAWGRHAAVERRSWWTPIRWLMAMTLLTLILGALQKAPCADGNWTGTKQYTHFCYSDVVPLWSDERLDVGAVPYRDTAVEYPVLTGAFMWLTADLTRGVHALVASWSQLLVFDSLTVLLLALCGLIVVVATARAQRGRPYDAAIFALSPLLVFHAFSNWDLLAMAFMSGALWAWAGRRPILAGALIGLGTAAKLYPVVLFVALGILAIRTRRFADLRWSIGGAVASWCAVNLPFAIAYNHGWWTFYGFSIDRGAEASTVWAMARALADGTAGDEAVPFWQPPGLGVALAVLAAFAFVVVVGLKAPVRPRLAQLAFLCVLAFLLTTKVWSPQYSLWLVPLLALARPRWRLNLVWQFTEIGVWLATLTLLLAGTNDVHGNSLANRGISYGWLILILIVRDILLLVIAGLIVREMWRPELDVVRADGADDPGGGVFDGAPDRWQQRPAEPDWSAPDWPEPDQPGQIDVRR